MCSSGDVGIIRKIATQSGYTGSDADTSLQKLEKTVTGGVKKTTAKVDRWASQSGFTDSGKVDYASRFGNFTTPKITTPKVTVPTIKIPTSIKDTSLANIADQGTSAINQIKTETGKLAEGDFSLKNAVTGTVSGASKTFKESDAGKAVKIIADKSGYTGSDADKGFQKIEKETSNVVNQVLDTVDSPGKVIEEAGEKVSNFVEGVKKDLTDTGTAYGNVITNIGETGEKIGKIATDTFNTGMNVSSALGSNLAKQVMKAKADFSSAMGGITGGMEEKTSSRADLLERDRDKRRGGLSRSGTSRTLITGKY